MTDPSLYDDLTYDDLSILIVDDLPVNIELLLDLLERSGYRHLYTATRPREALELYRKQPPTSCCSIGVCPKGVAQPS